MSRNPDLGPIRLCAISEGRANVSHTGSTLVDATGVVTRYRNSRNSCTYLEPSRRPLYAWSDAVYGDVRKACQSEVDVLNLGFRATGSPGRSNCRLFPVNAACGV